MGFHHSLRLPDKLVQVTTHRFAIPTSPRRDIYKFKQYFKEQWARQSTTHLHPDTIQSLRKTVLLADVSKTLDTIKTIPFDKSASTLHGVCQNGGRRKPCFNFLFIVQRHIQLDVINLAMCISSTFIYKFSLS